MKKLTLILALLVAMVTTTMAQINYGKRTWTFPATSHEAVTEVPAKIFNDFATQYSDTELTNEKVGVYVTRVRVAAEGNVTATFAWNGGNIRMDIGGVDLVDADGNVVELDYHFGFAGGNVSDNVYTLENVAVGDYTMRIFIPAQKEDITSATSNDSKGTLTITGAWMYPNEGVYYNIKNVRSSKYATFKGVGKQFKAETANNGAGSYWYFVEANLDDVKSKNGAWLENDAIPAGYKPYYVYNAACEKAVENVGNGYMAAPGEQPYPAKLYYIGVKTNDNRTGLVLRPCNEDGSSWNDNNAGSVCHWNSGDPGSVWSIELANVKDDDLIAMGTTARTNALATVASYEQAYYFNPTTAQINATTTAINAIDCSTKEKALTSVIDGVAAAKAAELASCTTNPKAGDRFMIKGNVQQNDYLLAALNANVQTTNGIGDNNINALDLVWTLKDATVEGKFNLYNERLGVYVGALSESSNGRMNYTTEADNAGVYSIIFKGTNVAFHAHEQDEYGYIHHPRWNDKNVTRWESNDANSQWQLIEAPIELTTDLDAPICYAIKSGRDGNYYFTLENNKIKLVNNADIVGNDNAKWFFMLDEDKNLKIYPYADKANTMGYITVADGNTKLTNNHDADGFVADTYNLYYNTNNAANNNGKCFAFRPTGEVNTFVSNHGGTGNYMGFYNEHNDKGTRIGFENINKVVLKNKIAALEQYFAHEGDKVCQYIIADEIKTAVNNATRIDATKASTNADYVTGLNALTLPTINLPVAGNYYRIGRNYSGTMKYVQGVGSDVIKDQMNTLLISDTKDAVSIFYYGDDKLLSYTAGTYVNENGNNARGLMNIGVAGGNVTFEAGHTIGTIAVKAPSYMHANTSNGVDFIDHCSQDAGHAAHDFIIEEVETLPVTITAAGYASFYAPVAVTVPSGIEAHYLTKIIGEFASMTKIENGIIPANTGVMLTGEEGKPATADTYNFTITDDVTAIEGNMFEGTVAAAYIQEGDYVLYNGNNGVGLYPVNANQASYSHKAYLPKNIGTSLSNSLRFAFGGTTAVEDVEIENEREEIYDLTGRKLECISGAGIYIVNGKKVLVK